MKPYILAYTESTSNVSFLDCNKDSMMLAYNITLFFVNFWLSLNLFIYFACKQEAVAYWFSLRSIKPVIVMLQ
jgi:hypothetical protein